MKTISVIPKLLFPASMAAVHHTLVRIDPEADADLAMEPSKIKTDGVHAMDKVQGIES